MEKRECNVIYAQPTPPGVILEKNVYVEMRDGVKLVLDLYKPAKGNGPWPAIIGYGGFPKEHFHETALPAFYCNNGYVIVQAQARGSCLSEGKYAFHSEIEARDGYDIVEWLARQSWCNGSVGMMGASHFGVNLWITAILNPPHLKCIVPCPGTTDQYRGLFYPGGVFSFPFSLYIVAGATQRAIWPGIFPGKEIPENIVPELFCNTENGSFYREHGSSYNKIDQIKAAVLNICPAANELHTLSQLKSFSDIKAPKQLIITPWNGTMYQPFIFETTSLNQQILRWFDYWLKGIDTGIMNEPNVAIYDNGTGRWRYENEYPIKRTQMKNLYLHAKSKATAPWGSITGSPPTTKEKPDIYRDPSKFDQTHFVAYTTPPLEDDLMVMGPVSITFYASTTEEILTDWSFFVKLGEMVPNGMLINPITKEPQPKPSWTNRWTPRDVHLWSWGNLKAKFRQVDRSRSLPGQPFHSFSDPIQLKPNTIYEFQVELQPIFNTFKKGHKIWLQIAGEDPDYSTWDSSSRYVRKDPNPPMRHKISIYHDLEHPSHVLFPIIPDTSETIKVKAPLRDIIPGAPRFTRMSERTSSIPRDWL